LTKSLKAASSDFGYRSARPKKREARRRSIPNTAGKQKDDTGWAGKTGESGTERQPFGHASRIETDQSKQLAAAVLR